MNCRRLLVPGMCLVLVALGGCPAPPGEPAAPATEPQETAGEPVEPVAEPQPADAQLVEPADEPAPAAPESPPAVEQPADDAPDWLARASAAYEAGDLPAAEDAYRQATQADPSSAAAWQGLGVALRKLERYDESLAASHEALRLKPDYAEALGNVGNVHYRQGDPSGALEYLDKALELDPDYAEGHLTRGVVLHAQDDLPGAAAAYRRSIELDPDVAIAHSNLGIVLDALDDNEGALAAFEEAVRLDPKYAGAYNGMGKALWLADRQEEGLEAWKTAVRLRPDFAVARLNLASAYAQIENYDAAWEQLESARKLGALPDPRLIEIVEAMRAGQPPPEGATDPAATTQEDPHP